MTTTLTRTTRRKHKDRRLAVPGKKALPVPGPTERHKQRDAENRDKFPKRPKRGARPFETTMDF